MLAGNAWDKGPPLYERARHCKIIIYAPISKTDAWGDESTAKAMKGATRSTKSGSRPTPVASESDSPSIQIKISTHGTQAWPVQTTCP